MAKLTTKYTGANGSKLSIYAKPGKKGFHVGATLKKSGQPAQTGCRSTVSTEADALKAFNALKADAVKNGWTEAVKKDRNAFTTIPLVKKSAA
jgi:hypothetical protein